MFRKIIYCIALMLSLCPSMAQRQRPVAARVMTFNIRMDNPNDGRNNWEMRFQKVGNFLAKSKADIIGLQEVRDNQLHDIATALKNYDYVGVGRDDGKQAGEYNPLFYNRDRFSLLRSGTFWLSPTPNEPSYGWDAGLRRIATWAILQDKTTMKSIIVLNTHLDHKGSMARVNGATLIKERLSRMSNELPIVITGDMNVSDDDPAYQKMTTGMFPMQDAFKVCSKVKGPAYIFHDFGALPEAERHKIDYILLSTDIKVKAAAILDTSLGNGYYLSDHNAHTADIQF